MSLLSLSLLALSHTHEISWSQPAQPREKAQRAWAESQGYQVELGCTDDGSYVTLVRGDREIHAMGMSHSSAMNRAVELATQQK